MVLTFDGYNETKNESEQTKKEFEELKAKMEILQANSSNVFEHLKGMKRRGSVQIIAWNEESGSEGLFKAAAIARARNEAREKEHQRRYHHHHHHHHHPNYQQQQQPPHQEHRSNKQSNGIG
jgi:hypothetical protein